MKEYMVALMCEAFSSEHMRNAVLEELKSRICYADLAEVIVDRYEADVNAEIEKLVAEALMS